MTSERTPGPTTLAELLREPLRDRADAIALAATDHTIELTYAQLDSNVRAVAAELRQLGIASGDAVVVVSDSCPEFAVALLAIVSLGAAVSPISPTLPPAQLAAAMLDLSATAVVAPDRLFDAVAAAQPDPATVALAPLVIRQAEGRVALAAGAAPARHRPAPAGDRDWSATPTGETVALLLRTSGTTAKPKTVPLTHANAAASIRTIRETYRLGPGDATLVVMPVTHGHGLFAGLLAGLATGGAVHFPAGGRFSASTFWTDMVRVGATWFTAVPTIHQILLQRADAEYPHADPPALRFIRSCSAPLAPAVLAELEATFAAPVLEAYGMTETSHQAASNPLPAVGAHKASSVGLATGVTIRILGTHGEPAADGEVGEVVVRGPSVTGGYLDNPRANSASFTDGWFHTGDLGLRDADGYLFLQGRIKELINRGGEKISPQHVDEVLLSDPAVADALTFGVPDPMYGEAVLAAVVLKPGAGVQESDLLDHCRGQLSPFEVPERIHVVAELPQTAKGAGDRRRLSQLFGAPP